MRSLFCVYVHMYNRNKKEKTHPFLFNNRSGKKKTRKGLEVSCYHCDEVVVVEDRDDYFDYVDEAKRVATVVYLLQGFVDTVHP